MLPDFLERRGVSSNYIFARAGLRGSRDVTPNRIVARAQICALLNESSRILGDELVGPNIVRDKIDPNRLGLTGRALLQGPTIYESLRGHARLMPTLQSNVRLGLKVRGDKAYWFLNYHDSDPDGVGVLVEGAIAFVIEVIRHFIGPDWLPDYVLFPHQPRTSIERYETLFGAPVRFRRGLESVVAFDSSILTAGTFSGARPRSSYLLSGRDLEEGVPFEELTDEPASPDQFIDAVSCVVDGMLMAADVSMARTASALGYAPRTLQRLLSKTGTSFEAIADSRRRARSADLLADATLSVAEIAMAVGYSDTAHFIRAFHRWHSKTPIEFRRGPVQD
jgi:AraC-like DNA-binding protein